MYNSVVTHPGRQRQTGSKPPERPDGHQVGPKARREGARCPRFSTAPAKPGLRKGHGAGQAPGRGATGSVSRCWPPTRPPLSRRPTCPGGPPWPGDCCLVVQMPHFSVPLRGSHGAAGTPPGARAQEWEAGCHCPWGSPARLGPGVNVTDRCPGHKANCRVRKGGRKGQRGPQDSRAEADNGPRRLLPLDRDARGLRGAAT